MAGFPLKTVSFEEDAAKSWALFQHAFEKFLTATKQKNKDKEIKAALLYGHAGEDLQKAILGWELDEATMKDYDLMKAAITRKLTQELNPSYASLIFNLCYSSTG